MPLKEIIVEVALITLSFCLLLSAIEKIARKSFLQYYLLTLIVHISVDRINPQYCILCDMTAAIVLNRIKCGKWPRAFYSPITSAMILTIIAIISGNIELFIINPIADYSPVYSVIVNNGIIFIFSIAVTTLLMNRFKPFRESKSMIVLSVYNLVVLFVFYVTTPLINTLDKENMLLILLLLNLGLAGIGNLILSIFINAMEQKKMQQEILREKENALNKEQTEIRKVKHFFSSRYQFISYFIQNNDFQGLIQYFNAYIEPLYHFADNDKKLIDKINKIPDEAVKLSVFSLFNKCMAYGIGFFMDLEDMEPTGCRSENDLLTILGIYAENAFLESKDIQEPEIHIRILQDGGRTIIEISNTYGDLSIEKNKRLYDKPIMEKRYGQGILIAEEVSRNSGGLSVNTWKNSHTFTQQIIIERK